MPEDLAALLSKLREVDPETWTEIAKGIPLKPRGQYLTYDNGEIRSVMYESAYIPFSELRPEVAMMWLQDCIQRACEGRGWEVCIRHRRCYRPGHQYGEWITKITTPIYWDDMSREVQLPGRKDFSGSSESSPGTALLAAYLAAVQKSATKDTM